MHNDDIKSPKFFCSDCLQIQLYPNVFLFSDYSINVGHSKMGSRFHVSTSCTSFASYQSRYHFTDQHSRMGQTNTIQVRGHSIITSHKLYSLKNRFDLSSIKVLVHPNHDQNNDIYSITQSPCSTSGSMWKKKVSNPECCLS